MYDTVNFNRVSPDEAVAIMRLGNKIGAVWQESIHRSNCQRTDIFAAFDELDFQMYVSFKDYERAGC